MTVYPGTEPPVPDRHVGQMPEGWKPTPPTAEDRVSAMRQLAEQDRAEAKRRADNGASQDTIDRLLARAAGYEEQAEQYAELARVRREHPEAAPATPAPRTTYVIGEDR